MGWGRKGGARFSGDGGDDIFQAKVSAPALPGLRTESTDVF